MLLFYGFQDAFFPFDEFLKLGVEFSNLFDLYLIQISGGIFTVAGNKGKWCSLRSAI